MGKISFANWILVVSLCLMCIELASSLALEEPYITLKIPSSHDPPQENNHRHYLTVHRKINTFHDRARYFDSPFLWGETCVVLVSFSSGSASSNRSVIYIIS